MVQASRHILPPIPVTASWSTRLPGSHARIGISRGPPRGQCGYRMYGLLAPGPWFKSVAAGEFQVRYMAQLARLDPQAVLRGPAGSRRACRRPGAGAVVLRAAAARPSLVPPRARLRLVSRHARARDLRIRPRVRGLRLAPSQAAGLTFAPVVQSGVCAVEWDQLVLAEAAG